MAKSVHVHPATAPFVGADRATMVPRIVFLDSINCVGAA